MFTRVGSNPALDDIFLVYFWRWKGVCIKELGKGRDMTGRRFLQWCEVRLDIEGGLTWIGDLRVASESIKLSQSHTTNTNRFHYS